MTDSPHRVALPAVGFLAACADYLAGLGDSPPRRSGGEAGQSSAAPAAAGLDSAALVAPPPCVAPNLAVAAELRRGGGARRLPRFVTLSRLAAAADCGEHLRGAQLAACAALLPDDFAAAGRETVHSALFDLLSECGRDPARADGQAEVLFELAAEGLLRPDSAPEELAVADDMLAAGWRRLRELNLDRVLFARRRALARLADDAPVMIDDGGFGKAELAAAGVALSPHPTDAVGRFLAGCWDEDGAGARPDDAAVLHFQSLNLIKTAEMEAAAAAALDAACGYLDAGAARVAIVVFDRACARRLRALAEHESVLLQDETGWAAATLSAGAALRTLAAPGENDGDSGDLAGAPSPHELAAMLQSPGFFEDLEGRESAVRELAALLPRRRDLRLADLADHSCAPLAAAANLFLRARSSAARPLAEWIRELIATADTALGGWFRADPVAVRLRDSLLARADSAGSHSAAMNAAEFNLRLGAFLERETISPLAVESPLVLTPLARAWGRRFDAAILLGANARNLPQTPPSDAVRVRLGLPPQRAVRRQRRQLALFLADHRRVTAVYHERGGRDEIIAPSPLLALLADDCGLSFVTPPPPPPPAPPPGLAPPRPAAAIVDRLPPALRVSDYATLLACPYRFFAARILELEDDDDAAGFSAADYGAVVHRIVAEFVGENGGKLDAPRARLEAALLAISRRRFAEAGAGQDADWHFNKWRERIPAYLDWEIARFADGWRPQAIEAAVRAPLALGETGGKTVTVRGRIDRIDRRGGEVSVIDYKTGSPENARAAAADSRREGGEYPQLPMYGFLHGGTDAAALLALDARDGAALHYPTNADAGYARALAIRWGDLLAQAAAGAPLPANGALQVCRHCDKKGLCRKDHLGR